MGRKHFQSHWKDLLAEQAARTRQDDSREAPAPKVDRRAEPSEQAETEVDAEEDVWEDDDAEETAAQGFSLKTALHIFHEYRYPALAVSVSLLVLCLLALNWPDHRPERVPVAGQVLIDEQPLTSGTVFFLPEGGGRPAVGRIDPNGRFTLACYDDADGAIPGRYRVEIAPSSLEGEELTVDPSREGTPSVGSPTTGEVAWPVPERYLLAETSGLAVEITGPTRDLVIRLTTEGIDQEQGGMPTEERVLRPTQ